MIVGLSSSLSSTLFHGLVTHGVPARVAAGVAHLPPISTLFAAFLGYNPVQHLISPLVLSHLSAASRSTLLGRRFFPTLISTPFRDGLHTAFDFAIAACLVAAVASWMRGGKYVYNEAIQQSREDEEVVL